MSTDLNLILESFQKWLNDVPDCDWSKLRTKLPPIITQEKLRRQFKLNGCVLEMSVENLTEVQLDILRKVKYNNNLLFNEQKYRENLCLRHFNEYRISERIQERMDGDRLKKESYEKRKQEDKRYWDAKKSELVDKFIQTKGKCGNATPARAFNHLRQSLQPEDYQVLKSMNYKDFLNTPYWWVVRNYILYRYHEKCDLCPKTSGLHVHHRSYRYRGEEINHIEDLIVLCDVCHARHHDKLGDLA